MAFITSLPLWVTQNLKGAFHLSTTVYVNLCMIYTKQKVTKDLGVKNIYNNRLEIYKYVDTKDRGDYQAGV